MKACLPPSSAQAFIILSSNQFPPVHLPLSPFLLPFHQSSFLIHILLKQPVDRLLVPRLGNKQVEQIRMPDSKQCPSGRRKLVFILIRSIHLHKHVPHKAEFIQHDYIRHSIRFGSQPVQIFLFLLQHPHLFERKRTFHLIGRNHLLLADRYSFHFQRLVYERHHCLSGVFVQLDKPGIANHFRFINRNGRSYFCFFLLCRRVKQGAPLPYLGF